MRAPSYSVVRGSTPRRWIRPTSPPVKQIDGAGGSGTWAPRCGAGRRRCLRNAVPRRTNVATGACSWFTAAMGTARSGGPTPDPPDAHAESREAELQRREAAVEARETAVEARETAVEARDAAHADRKDAARGIGTAADERDVASGARDAAAERRENDLDRAEMLDTESEYGAHWPERRNASLDRGHAKDDRRASHEDRLALTENDAEQDPDEI